MIRPRSRAVVSSITSGFKFVGERKYQFWTCVSAYFYVWKVSILNLSLYLFLRVKNINFQLVSLLVFLRVKIINFELVSLVACVLFYAWYLLFVYVPMLTFLGKQLGAWCFTILHTWTNIFFTQEEAKKRAPQIEKSEPSFHLLPNSESVAILS